MIAKNKFELSSNKKFSEREKNGEMDEKMRSNQQIKNNKMKLSTQSLEERLISYKIKYQEKINELKLLNHQIVQNDLIVFQPIIQERSATPNFAKNESNKQSKDNINYTLKINRPKNINYFSKDSPLSI